MNFDDLDRARLRERTGEKWQRYDADVLPAWVADMDLPVAQPIRDLLQHAIEIGDIGYALEPHAMGVPDAFAERVRSKWDWEVDPARVDVITDVVQGIYLGLETLCEPGEGVLVQTPVYPPFLSAPPNAKRRVVSSVLQNTENGFAIDFDELRAKIDPTTRVFLLCNPHNPTGRVFTRAELAELAEIVLERDLVVIADEIHSELVFDGRAHVPFATLGPEIESRTLTLASATKAFNIAGLRCSVAVSGSAELHARFNRISSHTRGGLGALGLLATRCAWTECDAWLEEAVAYLQSNRDFLGDFVRRELPQVRYHRQEATYLAWLDCRALELEPTPMRYFLDHARVALSEGQRFGDAGRGFARINFATSRAILTEILERMAKSLQG